MSDILAVRPTMISSVPQLFNSLHSDFLAALVSEFAAVGLDYDAEMVAEKNLDPEELRERIPPAVLLRRQIRARVIETFKDRLGGRVKVAAHWLVPLQLLTEMQIIVTGGAAVSGEVLRFLASIAMVFDGYGITEAGGKTHPTTFG